MVGYSRLIGLDDAGTLRRLRTLRRALFDPAIRACGGRVVQTGGNSLLIAFDSIDGAVRCAVKVQQQVPVYDGDQLPDRRIRFRIGINIGDVISDDTDLHGDGVNIAARLQAECPAGGICVSRSVRDHVHGRLDLSFTPIGPLALRNIARPVEAFVLRLVRQRTRSAPVQSAIDQSRLGHSAAGWRNGSVVRRGWRCGMVASSRPQSQLQPPAVASARGRADRHRPGQGAALVDRRLPFENLSGDPRDDYLAEGITEDITTDLSRVPGMFVIARESAYTYQGKAVDVRKIGEELGVRYVLEGSVRKLGDALRVNAQLIATETGAHLWADRFDQKLDDLSAGQEAIVDRIGQTLNVHLPTWKPPAVSGNGRPIRTHSTSFCARGLSSCIPWVRRSMRNARPCSSRPSGSIPIRSMR